MTVRRGRPRSAVAHQAILEATRDLLTEHGYEGLTIDAIAATAGVGRQTIYRWWPSKAAIVAESVLAGVITQEVTVPENSGDLGRDLRDYLHRTVQRLSDPRATTLMRALAAASAERVTDGERLYEQTVRPLRHELLKRLALAADAGELRLDADLEAVADAIFGTALYRVLARSAPPSDSYADGLVDALLAGIRAPTPDSARRGPERG